jgi:hypothetical protein
MITTHNTELAKITRSIEVLEVRILALDALLNRPGIAELSRMHDLILGRRDILQKDLEVLRERQAYKASHVECR